MSLKVFLIVIFSAVASATVYFKDEFDSPKWADRWVQSEFTGKEFGKFDWTAGKFYGDDIKDKGIKTSQDARFYAISTKFDENKFSNEGKDLVIQYTVKHEQNIDCGGGYLKLFDCALDQKQLHGESPYLLMFGPDICGSATKKVHVIFNYKGKNLLTTKDIRCKDDVHTHVYRLVVKPDNTYKVLIDGEVVEKGELENDFSFLPPAKIKDSTHTKPSDWVDDEMIDDPEDKKPYDWDVSEFIPDETAKKPDDWDEEMDGEYEFPQVSNPLFKGQWAPKKIPNKNYKGPWVQREIDNPDYVPDDKLYKYDEICGVGIDVWQVKAGTIFDNILIGDDEAEADVIQNEILERIKEEKRMKERLDEEEKKATEAAEEDKKDKELDKEELDEDDAEDKDEEAEKHDEL